MSKKTVASNADAKTKRGPGRQSTYSESVATAICERLAMGESLRSICRDEGMPKESTVRLWVVDDVNGFAAQYARSRDVALDAMADELMEIADTPVEGIRREVSEQGVKEVSEDMLGHRRLQVDTRKWYLSKLAPKKYGDKVGMTVDGGLKLEVVTGVPDE